MAKKSSTVRKTINKAEEQKPQKRHSTTKAARAAKSRSTTHGSKARMTKAVDPRLIELRAAADQAKAKGELDRTIDLLTQALAIGNLPFEIEYDLLEQRCQCFNYAGDNAAYTADAQAMFHLAEQHEDILRQAAALVPWVDAGG
jgi:hypothetical protein